MKLVNIERVEYTVVNYFECYTEYQILISDIKLYLSFININRCEILK